MKLRNLYLFILFILAALPSAAQTYTVSGRITSVETMEGVPYAHVLLDSAAWFAESDETGKYELKNIPAGTYTLTVQSYGYLKSSREIVVNKDLQVNIRLKEELIEMDTVVITGRRKTMGRTYLGDVEGTAIYAGKKSEVVVMDDITANTATNNTRQIYSRISGLNIYENDGAGIQLGIGGRGLNPNRVSNFNTRQNGYDISADALGYPESYYSPPTEAIERIEIIRGAASLQYGTQFGGLVNFKLRSAPTGKKIQLVSRQSVGSFGFFNTFNSLGGTVKKVSYYTFYQHKSGNGWRPNSEFNVDVAYGTLTYKPTKKLSVTMQYTYMNYLAHQPGGLMDKDFEKNPRQSVRTRNWFKVNWNLGAVLAEYKISENIKVDTRFFGLLANRSAVGILTYITRADPMTNRDLLSDDFRNYGNETRFLLHYNNKKSPSTLLVGFRYYRGFTDRKQGPGNSGSGGTKSDFRYPDTGSLDYSRYTFPNHNIAVFAENIFQLNPKLSIIPGIRFENILTRAKGFYHDSKPDFAGNILLTQRVDENRVSNRSFLLGGIGMSYHHNNSMQFYANISQNYRAINFNDMRIVNPNATVDPNLHDERGYSADAGMRGNTLNILSYDVSLFLLNYANRIGTIQITDTSTLRTYRLRTNVSHSRNIGIESFAELDVWKLIKGEDARTRLSVFSNLTLLDARYTNSKEPAFENKKVELAPNVLFKTGITFKRNKLTLAWQFSYTGKQFTDATNAISTTTAINGIVPAYYVMDLSAQYDFSRIFTLYGSINNLTNNYYFTRRADSYPGPGIIPSDGRSFFLTLQVKL